MHIHVLILCGKCFVLLGFGAGTDRDSDWIACQDSFNDILSQLNDSQNTTSNAIVMNDNTYL